MFNLYFVRHGEAASSWDQSTDPGLSDLGRQQALTVSKQISEMSKPVNLVSSPLKRAQETSSPLSELWGTDVSIEPHIAEIPSDGISFDQRRQWLNMLMQSDWDGQADNLLAWKQRIIKLLTSQTQDSVFFTHFMY